MIRKFQAGDLEAVAGIWLASNIQAHSFIPEQYWRDNYTAVKEQLAEAELYVWTETAGGEPLGFIGLSGNYIAGLFVRQEARSKGVGRELLSYAKALKGGLSLSVYEKNRRAVNFYRREGFAARRYGVDTDTGETEMMMVYEP